MNRKSEVRNLSKAVMRIHANILAFILAIVFGFGLFVMTAWLLIKGGENVGAHLGLLGHFFIGYSVTWPGSFLGFVYGALTGAIIGWLIGWIYNLTITFRYRN